MEEKKTVSGKKKALIIIAVLLAAALVIYLCTALSGSKPADPAESTEPTESTEPVSQDKDPVSSAKPEASEKPETSPAPTESTAPTQTGASSSSGSGAQTGTVQQTGSTGNQNPGSTEHQHNWQAVYKTVHHNEAGHYETVTIKAAWDEQEMVWETVCNVCGRRGGDVPFHIMDDHDGQGSYGSIQVPTGKTIHHEAVTEQCWIIDTPAYDEQVITGYKCSCGQEKLA